MALMRLGALNAWHSISGVWVGSGIRDLFWQDGASCVQNRQLLATEARAQAMAAAVPFVMVRSSRLRSILCRVPMVAGSARREHASMRSNQRCQNTSIVKGARWKYLPGDKRKADQQAAACDTTRLHTV